MAKRGTLRTEQNAKRICDLIADGYTLRQVAKEIGVESAGSITDWARDDKEFAVQYARAKEAQADRFADEIIEIADDSRNDWVEREIDGQMLRAVDHEHIQRSRVRIDARKWLMAKMLPKKYGDRMALTGAEVARPIVVEIVRFTDKAADGD